MRRKSAGVAPALLSLWVVLFTLVFSFTLFADPVTRYQARQAATGWLSKHKARPLEAAIAPIVRGVDTYTDDDKGNLYYVVNLDPTGFVIVPADDLIEPIIAFAEKGAYSSSVTYPLGALVSGDMRGRMAHVRENRAKEMSSGTRPDSPLRKAKKKWDAYLLDSADEGSSETLLASIPNVRVSPLLESTWDQGSVGGNYCYNYWTTVSHYPCGCVATAMAQLMRYHSYPTVGIGQIEFNITVLGFPSTATTRGGDGSGGPYVWGSMSLSPDSGTPDAERQQIGYLTADAGYSVDMEYTPDSSGTDLLKAADALKYPFQYGNAVKGYNDNSNIPPSSYAGMINTNLDAALPVLLGITGPPGGHAIVGDGYGYDASLTMYHHLNMGWGSSTSGLAANAWYNLPNINDTPLGTFDILRKVIYNIYKAGSWEIISGRVMDASGNPLSGVTVTATVSGFSGDFRYVTGTNPKLDAGIYALTHIPPNSSVTLTASKPGYLFSSRTVTTGESTDNTPTSGNVGDVDFEGHAIQFSDGTLDMTFDPNANNYVYSITLQPDGKVLIGGDFTTVGGVTRNHLARLNTDGTLDTDFNPNVNNAVYSIAVQADNKILIGGAFFTVGGTTRHYIARVNADGSVDTAFNPDANNNVHSIAVQPDGKILLGCFDACGVGEPGGSSIARLHPDGSADTSFDANTNSSTWVYSIAVQTDGKILMGGTFSSIGGTARNRIARVSVDGTPDVSFNPGANGTVRSIVLQPDGKVLVGGGFTNVAGVDRNYVARLNADGTLDTDFGSGANDYVYSIALQPDGKTLAGGTFTYMNGVTRNRIARLNADGTLDVSFDPDASLPVRSIVFQPDGKILIGGQFKTIGGVTRNYIARLGFASPPSVIGSDFNQDGKPDILWRNTSTGQNALWYMDNTTRTGSAYMPSLTDQNWKIAGTSDFNQDGKPDILWRNTSTGQNALWYMNNATRTGSAYIPSLTDQNWKIAATADFNQDGKPDILWRNTSTGQNAVWYMDNATRTGSAYIPALADQNWKIAATADFNQDGKPDILWRNTSTGQNALWYMNNATRTGSAYIPSLTDQNWKIAATADFNQDGKPDILWRNTSTGQNAVWYMDNATRTGSAYIPALADQNWKMVGGQGE